MHKSQKASNGERRWTIEAVAQVNDEFGRCLKAVVPIVPPQPVDKRTEVITLHDKKRVDIPAPTTDIKFLDVKVKVIFIMDLRTSIDELFALERLLTWERIVELLRYSILRFAEDEEAGNLADLVIKVKASEAFVMMGPSDTVASEWILKIITELGECSGGR